MSVEDDTELRDIVIETLDQRGVIGKTKAMLRAHIFTALEDTAAPMDKIYMLNKRMREHLESEEGKLLASLLVEYFTFFELDFTKTVFQPETGFNTEHCSSRKELQHSLGLGDPSSETPLLISLLKRCQKSPTKETPAVLSLNLMNHIVADQNQIAIPKDLTPKQIEDAQAKFKSYDKDDSGTIDKDELRNLFMDMFPSFHKNMLERYVNDEFRAADTDFSCGIDFEEFVKLYRRLFVSCRSVVSHDISDLVTPRSTSPRQSRIPISKSASTDQTTPRSFLSDSRSSKASTQIPRRSSDSERRNSGGDSPLNSYSSSISSGKPKSPIDKPELANGDGKDNKPKSALDKNLADLGFELPDEEESVKTDTNYDDDFEHSIEGSTDRSDRSRSSRPGMGGGDSIKTDSISEDISDKVEDDNIDELLKEHDISWGEGDETTDRTFDDEESLKVDYWENLKK